MLRKTDEVRHAFARLINASDDEVGLLFSTSEGENVVTDALDLKRGDNVVIDDLAYPSTSIIHKRLQETRGIEVRIVKQRDGGTHVEDFARLVDNKTRLISVAWVSNLNGFRHDMKGLADLAHAHGAFLYTDAIQAVGMGPLDVRATGVDFLCCGGYKWLMAGFGDRAVLRAPRTARSHSSRSGRLARRKEPRRLSLPALSKLEEIRVRQPQLRRGVSTGGGARLSAADRSPSDRDAYRRAHGSTSRGSRPIAAFASSHRAARGRRF